MYIICSVSSLGPLLNNILISLIVEGLVRRIQRYSQNGILILRLVKYTMLLCSF